MCHPMYILQGTFYEDLSTKNILPRPFPKWLTLGSRADTLLHLNSAVGSHSPTMLVTRFLGSGFSFVGTFLAGETCCHLDFRGTRSHWLLFRNKCCTAEWPIHPPVLTTKRRHVSRALCQDYVKMKDLFNREKLLCMLHARCSI